MIGIGNFTGDLHIKDQAAFVHVGSGIGGQVKVPIRIAFHVERSIVDEMVVYEQITPVSVNFFNSGFISRWIAASWALMEKVWSTRIAPLRKEWGFT